MLNPTIPALQTPSAPEVSLDALVASSLCARDAATVAVYAALCGGSLLTWAAKLSRAA